MDKLPEDLEYIQIAITFKKESPETDLNSLIYNDQALINRATIIHKGINNYTHTYQVFKRANTSYSKIYSQLVFTKQLNVKKIHLAAVDSTGNARELLVHYHELAAFLANHGKRSAYE